MTARLVLATLGLAIAFAIPGIDPRLLTLNLGAVGEALDVPPGQLGFLASAASLVVAAAVLAVGNLGDIYGLKRLLVYGLVAHIGVELLGGLSPGYAFLLVTRMADGVALTAMAGLSLALLTVSVPSTIRPVAIGIVMATDAVLYGLSPLVGGWAVGIVGWRALFVVTPVLALVALLLIVRYVAEPPRQRARALDVVGVGLFGVALLGLIYGLSAAQNGITAAQAWAPLLGSALAMAVFVRHERRAPYPALELALFARPAFVVALLAVLTVGFLCGGFSVVLGQFGGLVLGLSAKTIGLVYLPGTVLLATVSILAGHLVAKYTARPVLISGLVVLAASGLVLSIIATPTLALWVLVLTTFLLNLGADLVSTPASDTTLSYAAPDKAGSVAAMRSTFGTAGYALGPTVYILVFNVFFQQQWMADAQSRGMSAEEAGRAVDSVGSSLAHSPGASIFDPNLVQQASGLALDWDFTNAIRLTMLAVTVVPVAVAILAYFLVPRRERD
ncbi:MFS transporter [Gordonia rhizosphera]|uniref:Putative drug resistance transporter n=1 Tax=Gordonia rhizosphera NBRC 16068 TaxID=1108045 RepID=K6WRL3_9ACTN|nr:MFS transporter [Gordonia rhizosphera]GAB89194.1 putative drug resistance transporter [Gordonia rhizosphera NBRC 16068]